jgi:hypothetical protein
MRIRHDLWSHTHTRPCLYTLARSTILALPVNVYTIFSLITRAHTALPLLSRTHGYSFVGVADQLDFRLKARKTDQIRRTLLGDKHSNRHSQRDESNLVCLSVLARSRNTQQSS